MVRFMNAPPPSYAEYCCQFEKRYGLTMRLRKGRAMTPTTGRELCVTPMEQPTLGLVSALRSEKADSLGVDEAGISLQSRKTRENTEAVGRRKRNSLHRSLLSARTRIAELTSIGSTIHV